MRSMSLQVSAQRRAEPATTTVSAAGCSRSAAASSSATGEHLGEQEPLLRPVVSPMRLQASEHVLLDLRAEPLEAADPLAARRPRAARRASTMPSSSWSVRDRLGAEARDPGHLDQRWPGTSPSASRPPGSRPSVDSATIFSWSVLPTPGSSVARPPGRAPRPRPGSPGSPGRPPSRRARGSDWRRRARRAPRARRERRRSRRFAAALIGRERSRAVRSRIDRPMRVRAGPVWVVLPTYNEADNLEPIVAAVRDSCPARRRILIVDDNSPDGTGEIADRLAPSATDASRCCTAPRKEGLGPAYVAGFRRALAGGAEPRRSRWTPTSPTTPPTCRGCSPRCRATPTWCSAPATSPGGGVARLGRRCGG